MNYENKKPDKTAVALSYNPDEKAPRVLAAGQGYLAEKIMASARQHNIPSYKDEKLANTLSKLDIGEYIPQELYEVVAEILVYVDSMDRIKGKMKKD